MGKDYLVNGAKLVCICGSKIVLFVTLPTPNYPKILQIKRRYSIIHSDE